MSEPERYEQAWRVCAEDGVGVLVRDPEGGHWWLLCPASATLYFGPVESAEEFEDCSIGAECDFIDTVHRAAGKLAVRLGGSAQEEADGER